MLNNNTLHYTTLHYNHIFIHRNNSGFNAAAHNIDPCGRFNRHPQGFFNA